MTVDISPLEQAAVTLMAAALSAIGGLVLQRLAAKFKVQTSAEQSALFDGALNKALAYGVTQEMASIKEHGWDHVQTQNAVVATALNYVVAREPAALAGVGLSADPTDPRNRAIITDALTRALPAAFTVAAASPATPPAPVPAVIAVPVSPSLKP